MRETKDQKINRLERQNKELKIGIRNILKTNKKCLKEQEKENENKNENIVLILKNEFEKKEKEYKLQIDKLRQEKEKLQKQFNENIRISRISYDTNEKEIERLKNKIYKLENNFLSRGIFDYEECLIEKEINDGEVIIDKDEIEWRKRRLEEFNWGWFATEKGSLPFFDKKLVITINPKDGRRLAPWEQDIIFNKIKDTDIYKELMEDFSSLEDDTCEKEDKQYKYGKIIYKELYEGFNFDFTT